WIAVRPATGNVAACENVTLSGSSASAFVGTATRSAHAPSSTTPATRAPTRGPEPFAAARSTTPARSQPGRQPAAAIPARRTSPRLSEIARTRTTASLRSGAGSAIGATRVQNRVGPTDRVLDLWILSKPSGPAARCLLARQLDQRVDAGSRDSRDHRAVVRADPRLGGQCVRDPGPALPLVVERDSG